MRQTRPSQFHTPLANLHNSPPTNTTRAKSTRKKDVPASTTSSELSYAIEQAKLLLHNQDASPLPLPQPLATLLKGDVPQPQWVISEVLPVGVTVLAGTPRAGKSVLALGLALTVAEGGLFLNRFRVEQGGVLYLGLEDSRKTFYRRVHQLLQGTLPRSDITQGEQSATKNCEWAGHWSPLHISGLADLEDWLECHPQARLIVIDSLSAVRPYADKRRLLLCNDPILLPLHYMAQTHHIAILLVHHLRAYDNNDAIMTHSSSQTLIDGTMLLRRDAGMSTARLTVNGRDICEQEIVMTFEPQRGYMLIEGTETSLQDDQKGDKILQEGLL